MSGRSPESVAAQVMREMGVGAFESEVIAEKASSLGHHGRLVEASLKALRDFDAAPGDPDARSTLLRKASQEVWAFLVQRELCGLRDQKQVIAHYGIPQEVLVRLGAMEKR